MQTRFLPAVSWAAVIFWVSHQPKAPPVVFTFEGLDKILHMVAYGVLCTLLLYGGRWPGPKRAWWFAILAMLYGVSDELHQYVVGREADFFDFVADSIGAVVAVVVSLRFNLGGRTVLEGATDDRYIG